MRKTEVAGIASLLTADGDYGSPEDAATAIIKWLDEDRAKRTSYVAVMQFGETRSLYYAGIGPYPGVASARQAVQRHPSAGMATKIVVIPMMSPEGLEALVQTLDAPPERETKEDKKAAERKFRELMNGEKTHLKVEAGGIKVVKVKR